ncbi:MAG: hypothetical protein ACRETY_08730 [Steroidobacteraceae bacterium]
MGIRYRGVLTGGCALALLLTASPSQAASDDYDWLGIVYVWASDISVDARDRTIDASFSDVLDKLDFGIQGHVEAQGDDFGGFADVTFMSLSDRRSRPLADFRASLDMTAVDLALVWSPGAERMTGTELYGGLRYIANDFDLDVDPVPPALPDVQVGVDASYNDLLLGARYIAPLSDRWRLMVNVDISGLDTEGTWSLGMFGVYRMGPHRFIAGYRHLEMEVEEGGERVTTTFSGPAIAYGYAF